MTERTTLDKLTVEFLHARCDEFGDCMLWKQYHDRGNPKQSVATDTGRTSVSVRRLAYELYHGVKLQPHQLVATCSNPLCIAKGCLRLTDKAEAARRGNAKAGVARRRSAASARTIRARMGKIDMETARAIRASDEPGIAWAKRLGVSRGLISNVRVGKSWKEAASPWAGL